MRKMASVQTIAEVKPIQNADAIEAARVNGWWVVVKKGAYNVGDTVVYLEIDSFLPEGNRHWDFLVEKQPKTYNGVRGHVLRTARLRGQISQGLIIPDTTGETVGTDVSDMLGVVKYDPPMPANLGGEQKGNFPSFIPKTDAERIQNDTILPGAYTITQKYDGTSATYYKTVDGVTGMCSRNWEMKYDGKNVWSRMNAKYGILDKLEPGYAVQGEIIGEGIQGNPHKVKGQEFVAFALYDIQKGQYVNMPDDFLAPVAEWVAGWLVVQDDGTMSLVKKNGEMYDRVTIEDVVSYADEVTLVEGIVFKSQSHNVWYKAISNKYLLRQK